MPTMSGRPLMKKGHGPAEKVIYLPEVGLAAVGSFKKQKEVGDFINFVLEALARNSNWLSTVIERQNNFRCALLVGAGPNRFQVQNIIYPSTGNQIQLEVELKDSEDYDKIAIAAFLKISNHEIDNLMKYIKTGMTDNGMLRDDLLKGKALGISYAILRPLAEKQYRVMERIVIGNSMKSVVLPKKRHWDETSPTSSPTNIKKRKYSAKTIVGRSLNTRYGL
ncbi:Uncharacterized protein OBRU01_19581 [Operophtera brumata]|uniref:Uncharacterized protein n=1 Tax=Operophtera brumata TaxID=104452 RepID=A0A0L7KWZ3_OPEBR|nr:Uncharacterized protein OBRU01_19581 [Operophtera brumata]